MAEEATLASRSGLVVPHVPSFWVPVRNLLLTVTLTAVAFSISGFLWKETGYEMLVIGMGWAHVILGFLFFFGRVWRKESGSRELFIFLCVLASVFLFAHYVINLTFLIFIFFLFHAFRDEVAIYFQTRDKTRTPASVYKLKGFIPIVLLALLMFQPQDFRQLVRRTTNSEPANEPERLDAPAVRTDRRLCRKDLSLSISNRRRAKGKAVISLQRLSMMFIKMARCVLATAEQIWQKTLFSYRSTLTKPRPRPISRPPVSRREPLIWPATTGSVKHSLPNETTSRAFGSLPTWPKLHVRPSVQLQA
jgi:hypothetical protein